VVHEARGFTELIREGLTVVVEDVGDDHLGSLGDERTYEGGAHAARAARDERDLPVEASHF
jgi:hypothetical protein